MNVSDVFEFHGVRRPVNKTSASRTGQVTSQVIHIIFTDLHHLYKVQQGHSVGSG